GLFTPEVISAVGKDNKQTGTRTGYSACGLSVKDVSGTKNISLSIDLSDSLIDAPKQSNKQLSGLVVTESRSSTGCSETPVTGRDPDRGITLILGPQDLPSDPCELAGKFIDAVINVLVTNPPKYEDTPGSLVSRDPCTDVDDKTLSDLLGGTD